MRTAQDRRSAAPGAFTSFARFVLCGGGVGVASSFAVAGLATWLPWAIANALITVVSTLLATELHARFTFGAGGRATGRQHAQSAGSAADAYAVTCLAMLVLQQLVASPGALLEQVVYLSASALAGVARFAVLRLVVFARTHRSQTMAAVPVARTATKTVPVTVTVTTTTARATATARVPATARPTVTKAAASPRTSRPVQTAMSPAPARAATTAALCPAA